MRYLNLYRTLKFCVTASLLLACSLTTLTVHGQKPPSGFEKERGRMMLSTVKDDLKKNYYDPNFHGMDIEARFKTADEKIKQATSLGQIFGIIAQVLVDLEDSHTFYLPPGRSARTDYGWQMQTIGEKVYITAVKPGSDADVKGLKEGDEVYSIDGIGPSRENLWKLNYMYRTLRPRPGMHVVLIKPDGKEQELDVLAKVQQGRRVTDVTGSGIFDLIREAESEDRLHRHRWEDLSEDVFVWKMPQFDKFKEEVDEFVGKFKKKKGVIIDLRGNGGGLLENLLRLVGNVIDHDVKIGDEKSRKESKPLIAKTRGKDVYTGKIIVLIDSNSGSASELFARVMQLEKRATVIGDRSAGAVMESRHYEHEIGIDVVAFYGVSITEADLIMTDGKSLERVGVTPDELMLPTPKDLAAKRDPVLAYAASLLGVTITPEKAGELFPLEWRK
ncbi:MAG TPA: S41 family peptidase [Pyrinomonadaceae bacterium]